MSDDANRHPIVYAAVVPASLLLFTVAAYIVTARPGCAAAVADFELPVPTLTQVALAMTKNSLVVFIPPFVLTGLMIWYSRRKPISHALCVALGCVTIGVGTGFLFYTATLAPIITLIDNLRS